MKKPSRLSSDSGGIPDCILPAYYPGGYAHESLDKLTQPRRLETGKSLRPTALTHEPRETSLGKRRATP